MYSDPYPYGKCSVVKSLLLCLSKTGIGSISTSAQPVVDVIKVFIAENLFVAKIKK